VWEAAMCAAKHKLANLTVIVDYNKLQSAGRISDICPIEPLAEKWRAFGFVATEVDGHDVVRLRSEIVTRQVLSRPSAVICHTVKGKGIPFVENDPAWHHRARLEPETIAALREAVAS
jgi:transketolase